MRTRSFFFFFFGRRWCGFEGWDGRGKGEGGMGWEGR